MDRFPREFVTEWRKLELPFKGERAVVAVSGGADSVSLLLVLSELARRRKITNELVVAHFDHGLRGEESLADAEFVRELAGSLAGPRTDREERQPRAERPPCPLRVSCQNRRAAQGLCSSDGTHA